MKKYMTLCYVDGGLQEPNYTDTWDTLAEAEEDARVFVDETGETSKALVLEVVCAYRPSLQTVRITPEDS